MRRAIAAAGLAAVLGCAPEAPPGAAPSRGADAATDRPPAADGRWTLEGGELRAAGGRLAWVDAGEEATLGTGLVGPPALAAGRIAAALDDGRSSGRVVVWTREAPGRPWTARVVVDAGGRPDRVALSPDGGTVAFVWGRSGVASVYTAPVDGSAPPVQRTNAGVATGSGAPGRPPAGFVPPPQDGPPRFEGDGLAWTARGAVHRVRWR